MLYVGKAGVRKSDQWGLRKRLDEYRWFGAGEPIGHKGGRYIWQLAGSDRLLVAWRETPDEDPKTAEKDLLAKFVTAYGTRPFANLMGGTTRPR